MAKKATKKSTTTKTSGGGSGTTWKTNRPKSTPKVYK